jgi:spore coat protein CotF
MRIDNNLNAMTASAVQIDKLVSNLADVSNTVADPQNQEVTQDLIDSIVGQIPEVISYEANAEGIKTQNAVADVLLNLKA